MLVGYVGSYGKLGLLKVLDLTIPAAPDAAGYASNRLGLWRRQFDRFTVYSFQPDLLASVTQQLRFEETKQLAQVRLHVGDVAQASITPSLNNLGYSRTRETALGNIRLMHALDQQLHVPPENCKEAAEFLMAAKLVCPLGGQYELRKTPDGPSRWTAAALDADGGRIGLVPTAPQGYVAPPLSWFRGLDVDATMTDSSLSAHGQITMQLPK
jgi:hypothetical protein